MGCLLGSRSPNCRGMRGGWLLMGCVLAMGVSLSSCKKHDPLQDPIPSDPIEFRTHLMSRMGPALKATSCKCCNKSLHQCYAETVEKKTRPRCPDT